MRGLSEGALALAGGVGAWLNLAAAADGEIHELTRLLEVEGMAGKETFADWKRRLSRLEAIIQEATCPSSSRFRHHQLDGAMEPRPGGHNFWRRQGRRNTPAPSGVAGRLCFQPEGAGVFRRPCRRQKLCPPGRGSIAPSSWWCRNRDEEGQVVGQGMLNENGRLGGLVKSQETLLGRGIAQQLVLEECILGASRGPKRQAPGSTSPSTTTFWNMSCPPCWRTQRPFP